MVEVGRRISLLDYFQKDLKDLFEEAEATGFEGVPHDYATTLNKNHGRLERRECWTISDPECLDYLSTGKEWPGNPPLSARSMCYNG